ncbi:MAG: type VII secretion protein EssC [bacterium]|nr:type VII secretion protein EssC [bacterium]
MSTILSAYTQNAYCEFLLPAVNNTDHEIVLKREIFGMTDDVVLKLEIINKEWFLKNTESYGYTVQTGSAHGALKDGDILTILERGGAKISLIVRETEYYFSVFQKFMISSIDIITIGSGEENQIVYQNLSLVSRQHAALRKTSQGLLLQDISSNGTFVNRKRAGASQILEVGDTINIYGLKMVYLGEILAVCAPKENAYLADDKLPVYRQRELPNGSTGKVAVTKEKKYFHRAPRNYMKLETDSIEIEAPPNPKEESKKPLWMVIGPSFTMMLPMLAGSILTIIGASSKGNGASMYMYTGIITAVGSALIGVFWALANIRYNKREIRSGEEKRFQAYSDYLIKRADFIRENYEKSRNILQSMYPPASVVAAYDEKNTELWSRNRKHEDFLCQRLGTGNLPFQMDINVPKERFTLINDALSERPRTIREEYSVLYDVPVNVDLCANKLIGITGEAKKKGAYEIIRLLTSQIAANNCYTDVKLIFLYDSNKEQEEWGYARFLPHVWSEDKKTRFVASNKSEASDILFELTQVLRMRAEDGPQKKETTPKPYYVLIVSDMELLEGELITKYIYECVPCYGLATLILAESSEQLPNECEYLLQKDEEFCGIRNLAQDYTLPIVFDKMSCEQLELFARRLLPIEVRETEKGRDIPSSLTFFEMQGIQRPEELNVEEKWCKNRTYENMRALIGVKEGGTPLYLDVHEKYHGPHGLVAGTTGSGKSETLQTYMLSLAINFSPDDIGYFIIDYKGGGMAGLFDKLPHMIGSISNLSGNQVRRAMVSIKSENRRRQRIFSENNVNNINQYTKLYKNGEAAVPIPHMFIIIDEFAELKKEESEFMKELISVAQVGRSLGVHLILATQKPSGTVDENIWSNAKFRLCLRVQDRQDSSDMLHKPDAAYITQAGRGYLQVGNDEVYELFQSGYSGAAYDESGVNTGTEIASMLSLTGKAALVGNSLKSRQQEQIRNRWLQKLLIAIREAVAAAGETIMEFAADPERFSAFFRQLQAHETEYQDTEYNRRRADELIQLYAENRGRMTGMTPEEEAQEIAMLADRQQKKLPEEKGRTQLEAVIEYLAQSAVKEGYTHQMQLWMPPLPQTLYLNELKGYEAYEAQTGKWPQKSGKWNLTVPVGLCDDPVNQAQFPLIVDFANGGHLAVCGTVVSGKSCFLQTLLFGLINRYEPDRVNLYVMDFSSHMLSCLEQAPHVGDVMYEDDTEKIDKFFHMMEGMIEKRKKLFEGGNYEQYVRANGVTLPAVVVVIDNFGAFREKTENRYDERVLRLSKESVGYGIYLVLTAAGIKSAEIFSKLGDNIKTAICLQMNDRFAYADVLRCGRFDVMPENHIKGRGLAIVGESVLEFQTALALPVEDDFKRSEEIRTLCSRMRDTWQGSRAKPIPVIPKKPLWAEFERLEEVIRLSVKTDNLPIGYDLTSADIYGIDLSRTYSYVVSGRSGTGKTNLLKAMIRSAAKKQGNLIVIEYQTTDLKQTAQAAGAEYIDDQLGQAELFKRLVEPFKERNLKKRRLIEEGKDETEIYAQMRMEKPYFIIVADIVPFVQAAAKPEESVLDTKRFVENITERGKLHNVFFFIGLNPDAVNAVKGLTIYENLIGYRTGIHLGGNVQNIRYFDFTGIPYTEQAKTQKTGIGIIPAQNGEEARKIVLPLVKGQGGI